MVWWMMILWMTGSAQAQDACDATLCAPPGDGDGCLPSLEAAAASLGAEGGTLCLPSGTYRGDLEVDGGSWTLRPAEPVEEAPILRGRLVVRGDGTRLAVEDLVVFAPPDGQGVELYGAVEARFDRSIVHGGGGIQPEGGVVLATGPATLTLVRTEVLAGRAFRDGGLILARDGVVRILGGSSLHSGETLQGDGGLLLADRVEITDDTGETDSRGEPVRIPVTLYDGVAGGDGGGLAVLGRGEVRGAVVLRDNASEGDGGAVFIGPGASLDLGEPSLDLGAPDAFLRRSEDLPVQLVDNEARGRGLGGAVYGAEDTSVSVTGAWLRGNRAWSGGAVFADGTDTAIRASFFCANTAEQEGGAVATTTVRPDRGVDVSHTVFHANEATYSGALAGSGHRLVHVHLTANRAGRQHSALNVLVPSRLDHVIVSGNQVAQGGITTYDDPTQLSLAGSHNVWWDTSEPLPPDLEDSRADDPLLGLSDSGSLCDGAAVWPSWHGAARDIGGAPAERATTDPDGTPLDAGAFGGATWRTLFNRQDADPVPDLYDCDDRDPSIHPAQDDVPYDGIDADCRGDDDFDVDQDGVPRGPDCDDEDPDRFPGNPEPARLDGIDQDCDGIIDEGPRLSLSRCQTGPMHGPTTAGWLLLGSLAWIRRRRRRDAP